VSACAKAHDVQAPSASDAAGWGADALAALVASMYGLMRAARSSYGASHIKINGIDSAAPII
jgi:hypothetical protein